MKKIFFLTGIFALLSVLTLNAQVTIGKNQQPDSSAVLDLQSNDDLGLLLPRVILTDTLLAAPLAEHVKGMFVYNTTPSGDGNVEEGIYYDDGRRWWPVNGYRGSWDVSGSKEAAILSDQDIYQVGQVTIGKDTLVSSAILNVVSKDKGILIPELTTEERQNITNPADGLLIYNTDEECFNYYNARISDWQSLCGGAGAAKFTTTCDSVVVNGTYVQGTPLTSANYLTIPINVTSPGSFNILGTTTNGYSFSYSGTITAQGQYFINVPALGSPKTAQDDNVMITGGLDTCYTTIPVQANIAIYSIDCSSISANVATGGPYFVKGQKLTTQTITLRVTVSEPGFYSISTPVTNGIAFGAQDNFTAPGTQTVTLTPLPNSTPTVNTSFPITINANSPEGNVSCSTTIPMTLPPMTYAVLGATGTYTWAGGVRATALTTANGSFSPTGIVKVVSLTQLWQTTNATTATNNLNNGVAATVNGVNYQNAKPDVVMFSSYGFTTPLPQGLATALSTYVHSGGCLIYATSDNQGSDAQVLLDGIFGPGVAIATNTTVAAGYHNSNQNDYQVNLGLFGDPIANGPYGNTVGKYWQEDNRGTIFVTQMPPNSVQICSANNPGANCDVPASVSTVWYNNNDNFVYFGDSTGSNWDTNTSTTLFPSIFRQSDGSPSSKLAGYWGNSCTAGRAGTGTTVVNSVLEYNAFAWCLQKAAVAGINPH